MSHGCWTQPQARSFSRVRAVTRAAPERAPLCSRSHSPASCCLRRLFAKLTDAELEPLLRAVSSEDLQELVRRTARFNWHGDLIRSVLRQDGIKSVLARALLR